MVIYPCDWEVTTVDKVADINTGRRNTQDNKPNGRYKFFVRSPIVERIDVADYDCEAVLTAGDGNAGKVFHYVNGKFSAHQRVYIINNFRNISGRFFYYYFSRYFIDEVRKYTAKSTVDSVRRPMIANMLIPLPPLKEQTAIAETLATFDTHITNLTELITKKKAIRDGALDELMTGRTRLKGFCGDWEVKRLLDCVRLVQGLTYAPNNVSSYGTLVLRSSNIQDNSLSLEDNVYVNMQIAQEKMIQEGDILVCVRNGSSDLIGKSCRLPALSNTTFGAFMSVLRGDKTGYIAKIFNSLIVQKQVRNRTSATINQITKKDFEDIIIPLPPLDEQIAIADTLSALDKEISSLETERAKISHIRDGAINDLLTGKVRLKIGI